MTNRNGSTAIVMSDKNKPFRVEETDTHVKLTLHGEFGDIEDVTEMLTSLEEMTERHSVIEVWIHSIGGFIHTMNEIVESLKQFDTVVTIAKSCAMSAGATIWSMGDLRVASPHTNFMFHRESYGIHGKTDSHGDLVEHQQLIADQYVKYARNVLTEEQIERHKLTEVWVTGESMIERGKAISYQSYCNAGTAATARFEELGQLFFDKQNGVYVLVKDANDASFCIPVEDSALKFNWHQYIHNAPEMKIEFPDKDNEEIILQSVVTADTFTDMVEAFKSNYSEEEEASDD